MVKFITKKYINCGGPARKSCACGKIYYASTPYRSGKIYYTSMSHDFLIEKYRSRTCLSLPCSISTKAMLFYCVVPSRQASVVSSCFVVFNRIERYAADIAPRPVSAEATSHIKLATRMGLEPMTFGVTSRRSNSSELTSRMCSGQDSNLHRRTTNLFRPSLPIMKPLQARQLQVAILRRTFVVLSR